VDRLIAFSVRGLPVPQGALVRSPSGGLYHRGRGRLDDWRRALAQAARDELGDSALDAGPQSVVLEFLLPRPAGHYLPANRRRPERELRAGAAVWHDKAPDIDKLTRAALDALTGVVWRDDRQVASLHVAKRYSDRPGANVFVRRLEDTL